MRYIQLINLFNFVQIKLTGKAIVTNTNIKRGFIINVNKVCDWGWFGFFAKKLFTFTALSFAKYTWLL